MNYYCQIVRDPNSQRLLVQIVDETGAVVPAKGALQLSLADIRAAVTSGDVPKMVLTPVDGVTDSTGAAVTPCFLLAPSTVANLPLKVAGGSGGGFSIYDRSKSYTPGFTVLILTQTTVGGVVLTPGFYMCAAAVPANGAANQIPQFPEPVIGTIYWYLMVFRPQQGSACNGSFYLNATPPA